MGTHNRSGRSHPQAVGPGRRILALLHGDEVPEKSVPRSSHQSRVVKYFVANIPYGTIQSELREFFAERVGTVVEFHIFRDTASGQSRGFGVLRTNGDALALNGATFQDRQLRIEVWDRE